MLPQHNYHTKLERKEWCWLLLFENKLCYVDRSYKSRRFDRSANWIAPAAPVILLLKCLELHTAKVSQQNRSSLFP